MSAADLALPSNVVTAGNGAQGTVAAGQGIFSVFHQSWAGYQSGVAADFNFQPIMFFHYQGSVFSDANSAHAYAQSGADYVNTRSTSVAPIDCTQNAGVPCQIGGYIASDGSEVIYGLANVNYCVIETMAHGDPTLMSADSDTVSKVQADTLTLGIQEAQNACVGSSPNPPSPQPPTPRPAPPTVTPVPPTATPVPHTEFHIVTAQLQKSGASSNAQLPALTKVKHGKSAMLYTLIQVTSGRAGLSASYSFVVKTGSKTVLNRTMTGVLHSPNPQGSYVASMPAKFKNRGTYVFTDRVTIDGITQSDATSFSVVK
jgi:hypothetical protein